MGSSRTWRTRAAAYLAVVAVTVSFSVAAQSATADFNKGDPVEVQEGSAWTTGTFVGVDRTTGWVEVQLDEERSPGRFPRHARGRMRTRTLPPHRVRASSDHQSARGIAEAAPARTWTDRSGQYRVEARFDRLEDSTVALIRTADGKRIEVPLERLSEEDARYVRERTEVSENPFGDPPVASAASGVSKRANWREVRSVRPRTFDRWTFAPQVADAGELLTLSAAADAEVSLHDIPGSDKFFESIVGIYISSDGARGVVCRTKGEVSHDSPQYLEPVDLERGKSAGLIALPPETALLDVEPDAGLVMYRPERFGFGEKSTLTIARLDEGRLTPVAEWEPYAQEDWQPRRDIDSGWFLGSERVMTINHHGQALTVWDVDTAQALTNVPVRSSIQLKTALSTDRTLLAVIMKQGVALIDLVAGRHVATVATEGRDLRRVALRGDNAQLAGLSDHGVTVWDLTTGELHEEFFTSVVRSGAELTWAGEYLLAQNRFLFDAQRRILLWEYQDSPGSGMAATMRSGRLWVVPRVAREAATVLVSAALPHAAALELAETLPSAEELLAVRPGDSVALEIDIDPNIDLADEVRKLHAEEAGAGGPQEVGNVVVINPSGAHEDVIRRPLAEALHAAGLQVVDDSDLVVKAVCRPQPQQTIDINVDGRWPIRPQDVVQRTVTPHATYLEMTLNGEVLWKRGFVATPGAVIFVQQGETLDDALQRLTQPNIGLFTRAKFSPYVARPGNASHRGAYGVSQLTSHGIIDGQASYGDRAVFD